MATTGQRREDFVMVKEVPLGMRLKDLERKLKSMWRVHRLSRPYLHLDLTLRQKRIMSVVLSFHLVLLLWVVFIAIFTKPGQYWERLFTLVLSLPFYYISQDIITSAYKTIPQEKERGKSGRV